MVKETENFSPKQNEEILDRKWISSFEENKQEPHPILAWIKNLLKVKTKNTKDFL